MQARSGPVRAPDRQTPCNKRLQPQPWIAPSRHSPKKPCPQPQLRLRRKRDLRDLRESLRRKTGRVPRSTRFAARAAYSKSSACWSNPTARWLRSETSATSKRRKARRCAPRSSASATSEPCRCRWMKWAACSPAARSSARSHASRAAIGAGLLGPRHRRLRRSDRRQRAAGLRRRSTRSTATRPGRCSAKPSSSRSRPASASSTRCSPAAKGSAWAFLAARASARAPCSAPWRATAPPTST